MSVFALSKVSFGASFTASFVQAGDGAEALAEEERDAEDGRAGVPLSPVPAQPDVTVKIATALNIIFRP